MAFSGATSWTIDRQTGNIRYIGDDHNGAAPTYDTVIDFHRWLQSLADDAAPAAVDDEMDITNTNPSARSTDNIITLINGYNIDDDASEHLYDGSIIQDGGDTIYDGIVNFGNSSVQIQIIQDGVVLTDDWWNYGAGATATGGSGTTLVDTGIGWTTNEWVGYTFLNTTDICQGIALSNTTDTITFASGQLHGTGTGDFAVSDNYLIGQPLNPNLAQGVSHRFMIKTRANGVDIDGRRLIGIARRFGNTYSEFKINGTARGNNVLALNDTADLNNTTAPTTAGGTAWNTDFSNTGGLQLIDVNDDGSSEEYYSQWGWINTHTINDLYERIKYETEDIHVTDIDGHALDGNVFRGITHSFPWSGTGTIADNDFIVWGTAIAYTGGTGTYNIGETIKDDSSAWVGRILSIDDNTGTGTLIVAIEGSDVATNAETFTCAGGGVGTVGGTPTVVSGGGVMHALAMDDDGTTGNLYVQVLKGTAPPNAAVIYGSGTNLATLLATNTLTLTATPTERAISTPSAGVSTGSAIIGSYGLGIATANLAATDKVFDLTNTQITPPNLVTNTITGVVSGEDRILVAATDSVTTDTNGDPTVGISYMTLATALTGATETSVVVNEDLSDADMIAFLPSSGYLHVVNDSDVVIKIAYSAHNSVNTFTITSTNFSVTGAAVGNSVTVGQMHLTTALTGTGIVAAVVNDIPGSTPATGTIRIVNDEGFHIRTPYSDYDDGTDTFVITSSVWNGSGLTDSAAIGNHVYVTYIDKDADATTASFQAVYDNDLNLIIVIRDGKTTPIKQYIAEWSFTSSSASTGAIRTTDA